MNQRQILLVACVLGALLLVLCNGCAVTQWQRDQDAIQAAFRDLHSADMERRIAEAQGVKVAK
jgi:hypothetical protein